MPASIESKNQSASLTVLYNTEQLTILVYTNFEADVKSVLKSYLTVYIIFLKMVYFDFPLIITSFSQYIYTIFIIRDKLN